MTSSTNRELQNMLSTCRTPSDVIGQYLNDIHPTCLNAACAIADPLRTKTPYPELMTASVAKHGFIDGKHPRDDDTKGNVSFIARLRQAGITCYSVKIYLIICFIINVNLSSNVGFHMTCIAVKIDFENDLTSILEDVAAAADLSL